MLHRLSKCRYIRFDMLSALSQHSELEVNKETLSRVMKGEVQWWQSQGGEQRKVSTDNTEASKQNGVYRD